MTDKERAREIAKWREVCCCTQDEQFDPRCDGSVCVRQEQTIAEALAAVREECADIADQYASIEGIAQRIAQAIRSRGT